MVAPAETAASDAAPSAPERRTRVYGVRHHGPGSARSLAAALEATAPDCLLIEGPPEAQESLVFAASEEMRPPVALLVYDPEAPRFCAFYPFAEFSPEWQAIRYGIAKGIPVRFIDLPQAHQLAEAKRREEEIEKAFAELAKRAEAAEAEGAGETADANSDETDGASDDDDDADDRDAPGGDADRCSAPPEVDLDAMRLRRDPLTWLARAAGHEDGERWWEAMVEQRREGDGGVFDAIAEGMAALRAELSPEEIDFGLDPANEARREAHMRQAIRAAEKEGFSNVAVVCGAWHVPALTDAGAKAKDDATLLKGLSKLKTAVSWVPWTYSNLARGSGYGAGVESPGYYDMLWRLRGSGDSTPRGVAVAWLTAAARLLRAEQVDASSASVIEAVRLAESLAALRGRNLPGLRELDEATQAVLLFGDPLAMGLIRERLVVGDRLGEVPESAPTVPLQQDLQRLQKKLRLKPSADSEKKELDLRKDGDLERSLLLHRLRVLDIPWGEPTEGGRREKGTFRETWTLQWAPELSVRVVEASLWGNTVETAATALARERADKSESLREVADWLTRLMYADLPDATAHMLKRMEERAAVAADAAQLMEALPPLATVLRYGSVRRLDADTVERVVDHLVARACLALPGACSSLDDDAADAMLGRIEKTDDAIATLEKAERIAEWRAAIERLADMDPLHGLVAGRCARLLLGWGRIDATEAARRLGFALSRAADAAQAGAWVEGFLRGEAVLLLHSDAIWSVLDGWLAGLTEEAFNDALPILRRTFARFARAERRQMGEKIKATARGAATGRPASGPRGDGGDPWADGEDFDVERARKVLPVLAKILG